MNPQLNMLFVPTRQMGYGRLGMALADEFRKQNITIYDHLMGTDEAMDAFNDGAVITPLNGPGRTSGRSNVALWISVPSHATGWWKGQTSVMFTMWEATKLPDSFREALHNFDLLIVPSMQNYELFTRYHHNVAYVPLGFDPDIWRFRARRSPDRFFYYLIGGSGSRKGTDLAVKAFTRLWGKEGSWGSGPEPRLWMKNPKGENWFRADGRIEMISGRISGDEEADLYGAAHCYLQPSRGEGFGLQPLQAIAQGCPTVLTDAHGHGSFAHLGWPVGYTMEKASYFIFGDAGDWWLPNIDDLCDQMRWVYDHYDDAAAQAAESSKIAHRDFTWRKCADGVLDAIGRDNLRPYEGPEEWFQPELKLYPIVTRENFSADIGARQHTFEAGKEYWTFADVKRVLFEAGKLNPCCLDEFDPKNNGLTPDQVERIGGYRAENGTCPTCGRDLEAAHA